VARDVWIGIIVAANRNRDGSAKKPGKPKPTAGKGMNKNIVTKGGKAGRAIENKMRSAMSLPKLQTTGKTKAIKKAAAQKPGLETRGAKPTKAEKINRARDLQFARIEKRYDSALPAVGLRGGPDAQERGPKGKNLRKREAIRKEASSKIPKKVPVKPKGGRGLRGGMGLGGGGTLRSYNR
jgi:hypothetical protein